MKKIILTLKLILRSKFIFKTPEKHDLIIFDETSVFDLSICLSKLNFFVLQTRPESMNKIYFSYEILKKIFKNYFKGNLFTVYLISLIELIRPKVVITNIDNSFKFSDVARILEEKTNFIAIQNATRGDLLDFDYLYKTKKIKHNFLKKLYIPNLYCFGDYERDLYRQLDIKVKNIYPIGNLRLANCLYHIKTENDSSKKYNSDICLIFQPVGRYEEAQEKNTMFSYNCQKNRNIERGLAEIVKYTVKFCIKNNMRLVIPCKRDKKYSPGGHKLEIEFLKRNLSKEEFDYVQSNLLEKDKDRDNFSSFRAVLNSEVTVASFTTLLKDKLAVGGKILSCNLTKVDRYNFPVNGICTLNNCSYEEFEKRLLEIYSISKESYFSKIDKKPDYVMRFNKNNSTINLIREKLLQFGVNQN